MADVPGASPGLGSGPTRSNSAIRPPLHARSAACILGRCLAAPRGAPSLRPVGAPALRTRIGVLGRSGGFSPGPRDRRDRAARLKPGVRDAA